MTKAAVPESEETVDRCEDVLREPQHERSRSPSNEGFSAHPELVEGCLRTKSTDSGEHGDTPLVLPDDEHNRALVSSVHPRGWVNPTPAGRYNLVVVGAGTAGLVSAAGAAGLGAKVALVEKHLMGGDCLNVGCVPSKALISAARVAAQARSAAAFGVHVSRRRGRLSRRDGAYAAPACRDRAARQCAALCGSRCRRLPRRGPLHRARPRSPSTGARWSSHAR